MTSGQGLFIAIEGTDGAGKETQCKQLAAQLTTAGYEVVVFDFPQYGQPSSYFVTQYLNGQYGRAEQVGPYTSSLFYALDRYEAAPVIRQALHDGKIVLANRFAGSNMAHQGGKFKHAEERRGFFIWLDNLEFEMLKIPRPKVSLVLRVPAETAQTLVDKKSPRAYTDKQRDIHEADLGHLQQSVQAYDDLCQLFPADFVRIDCTREGKLLSIATIHAILWQKLLPHLPPRRNSKQTAHGLSLPSVAAVPGTQTQAAHQPTQTATAALQPQQAVSTLHCPVYAFTQAVSQAAAVTVMARIARHGHDLPTALNAVLAEAQAKDHTIQQNLINTYGEHLARQLTGAHVMIEQVSSLLAGKVAQSRSAVYMDRAMAYTPYEQKTKQGAYRYYIPDYLEKRLQEQYLAYMDQIFNLHAELVAELDVFLRQNADAVPLPAENGQDGTVLARHIARAVLPLAAQTAIGMYGSGQALESLILRLMSDPLPETRKAGENLLTQVREVLPAFTERIATPERGGAAIAYQATTQRRLRRLIQDALPQQHADPTETVQLTDVWPRNELDIIPDLLYKHSTMPLQQLRAAVQAWPYDKKLAVLETYIGDRGNHHHRPGRALEKIHYSWDLMVDYDTFRELQQHHTIEAAEDQELTPRYGYAIPALIEQADLSDQYEACFDLSLRLYSLLQQAGYQYEAQYATLHGHKLRCKMTYNAREAFRIHAQGPTPADQSSAYRSLLAAMHAAIHDVHPLLAEAMKTVGDKKQA